MNGLQDNSAIVGVTLAIGIAILLFFEWRTDEPLVVLPVLLLIAFVSGWIVPTRAILVGLSLGVAILIAHALTTATGTMIPRYQKQPPSMGDWVDDIARHPIDAGGIRRFACRGPYLSRSRLEVGRDFGILVFDRSVELRLWEGPARLLEA